MLDRLAELLAAGLELDDAFDELSREAARRAAAAEEAELLGYTLEEYLELVAPEP